jgi:hypothetical protein
MSTANVILHVGAGAFGLVVGLVPLLSVKGGIAHRRWGRYFVAFATVVVGTAVFAVLAGTAPGALVAVTVSAAYQLIGALRALRLRGRAPNAMDALLAVTAIVLSGGLLLSMGSGNASFTPAIGYSTLGYVIAVALYDLSRHFWSSLWSRAIWPLDHGLKMTAVYFAMMSAGAGNILRGLQPCSQILPSSLGMLVMIALAVAYFRKPRLSVAVLAAHQETA